MKITLKDNVIAEVKKGTTVAKLSEYISESLAKNAICGKINGRLVDLNSSIGKNCKLEIITMKDRDAINVLWHSSSHILAQAVKSVYPNTRLATGGYDELGFYYDFEFKTPITEADLPIIEDEMQKIIKANFNVVRIDITREQAFTVAEEAGEPYKLEFIDKLPQGEVIGLYTQGDFADFCDGPHLKSTGLVKAFKLTKITKSYSEYSENKSLTRVYGVSFFYKKDLDLYLKNQDIIAKRNHMVIGEKLGYFSTDEVGGNSLMLQKGNRVIGAINNFVCDLGLNFSYNEISSLSDHSKDPNKIIAEAYRISLKNGEQMPLKYSISEEHINKLAAPNMGLYLCKKNHRHKFVSFLKVQNIDTELKEVFSIASNFYEAFGFPLYIKLYVGEEELNPNFSKLKSALKKVLDRKFGDLYSIESGYYKLDIIKVEYIVRDFLNRDWVVGNCYIDLSFAQNHNIVYTEEEKLLFPITIVNNLCKSYERLFAIIIESYSGILPFWLAPTSLEIVAEGEKAAMKATKLVNSLKKYNIIAKQTAKLSSKPNPLIPLVAIIGKNELKNKTIRVVNHKEDDIIIPVKKFVQELVASKINRSLTIPQFTKIK